MGFNHLEDWELRKLQRELKKRSPWSGGKFLLKGSPVSEQNQADRKTQDSHDRIGDVMRGPEK